ncbi:MAG: peptidylprolyl isomerase [Bacteroidetes bacterium]|jgi:peptidyl-prolyl cis-trans isomerase A (cyclophilin A)|nr:peptidylprolyl isomerase [Bacteroidota bacterium]MDA1019556.1 peptidylprolyl isomerase [Bacteroidota bacterium]|tara:strand:+ start:5768 stop:6448 length:681 start_codon:yes stop_codon:yes gene_type:complete
MHFLRLLLITLLFFSCKDIGIKAEPIKYKEKRETKTSIKVKKDRFLLNDKNVIPFFFEYGKKNTESKIKIITDYGDIEIKLFKNTPYHRSNFIYLIKKKYFNNEYFHRVVKGFIIQGGNSDNKSTSIKRRSIGKYLLPPDTKKGYRHDRGIISMPSSEMENPYRLASPYEFFIVQKLGGAYHLDGNYTPFGRVTKGMNVVDVISNLEVDKREWPLDNVHFKIEIIE